MDERGICAGSPIVISSDEETAAVWPTVSLKGSPLKVVCSER